MSITVGPSHHFFYGALCRRRLWFIHLAEAFAPFASAAWVESYRGLDANYKRSFSRLVLDEGLGIGKPLPLYQVIDDTPIESFLINIADDLDSYQQNLLALMSRLAAPSGRQGWLEELERVSMLWGRNLAQECLMTPMHGPLVRSQNSVRGIFEAIHNILQGGDFLWKPFLVRRYTDKELQYELRHCPHRRPAADDTRHGTETNDLACRLEALVIRGFAEALISNVSFGRQPRESYCLDELRLLQL